MYSKFAACEKPNPISFPLRDAVTGYFLVCALGETLIAEESAYVGNKRREKKVDPNIDRRRSDVATGQKLARTARTE